MLAPEKLKKAFAKVEEENWMLRSFLKGQEPDEVDRIVNGLHKELFDGFDCVACSNCCKAIVPLIEENEINAISSRLALTTAEFKSKYLVRTGEGFMINKKPCPFLTGSGCSIYECRPENCREYPFTHKEYPVFPPISPPLQKCSTSPPQAYRSPRVLHLPPPPFRDGPDTQ